MDIWQWKWSKLRSYVIIVFSITNVIVHFFHSKTENCLELITIWRSIFAEKFWGVKKFFQNLLYYFFFIILLYYFFILYFNIISIFYFEFWFKNKHILVRYIRNISKNQRGHIFLYSCSHLFSWSFIGEIIHKLCNYFCFFLFFCFETRFCTEFLLSDVQNHAYRFFAELEDSGPILAIFWAYWRVNQLVIAK